MELIGKSAGNPHTPVKDSLGSRSKNLEGSRRSENFNPNFSPGAKPSGSPLVKSAAKSQKSASRSPRPSCPPVAAFAQRNKIRERKFVVAKKKSKRDDPGVKAACKCNEKADHGGNARKCLCVAYENLRASQEGFFKKPEEVSDSKVVDVAESELEKEIEKGLMIEDLQNEGAIDSNGETGNVDPVNPAISAAVKRRRAKLMEEARNSAPESGKVMHLVKAFEKLLSIPKSKESDETENAQEVETEEARMKWALPGLPPPKAPETRSSSSLCREDLFLTLENLGLDPQASVSSSWDGSLSVSSRNSNGGRRSRRNSSDSASTISRCRWKSKKLRVTSQRPFKLRTEQRGRMKEEEFTKKVEEMMQEEEKLRIPIAQGLPWTTDEPECLVKPPVKDATIPIDLKLHSDVRAVERAEFDNQVAEKMTIIEQYKMERERKQKDEEEEEVRRLRKDLVPKAQPMPYFDRPFIPRRSVKQPTIPREPRFHIPQQKKIKCCSSWSDVSSYTSYQD